MNLFPELKKRYTVEQLSAREAQRQAEFIAWGAAVFQASRLMVKFGILDLLRDNSGGMTEAEMYHALRREQGLSRYAVKCLLEAGLTIGTVLIDTETDRYMLSKIGWFLLTDEATKVNMDFNHYVNYEGWYHLEESLREGMPVGLRHFGDWPTVYEGLSSLPERVQKSWFGFDHFYSDSSFPEALEIVFRGRRVRTLYDVGGNTGKWALQCVHYDLDVVVTVLDLPQQIDLMRANVEGELGADRIRGVGINLVDPTAALPKPEEGGVDVIWMSQFLDCFGEDDIVGILSRVREAMDEGTRLFIMETFWDRQKYEPAAFCLTMTSLYFTTIANGKSKMYHSEDMERLIRMAGLEVEEMYDGLGQGHSVIVVKR